MNPSHRWGQGIPASNRYARKSRVMSPSTTRNILITGASTGIGRASAVDLSSRGYRVFGSVRKEADAASLREATPAGALPIEPLLFDVTDTDGVRAGAARLEELLQGEGLHALVNNAGVAIAAPLEYIPLEDFQLQMDINMTGVLRCTQAFLPALKRARGRIINISSLAGRLAFPLAGPYHSSKHALEGFSDVLRMELRRHAIDVVVIQPGAIQTEIWDTAAAKSSDIRKRLSDQAIDEYGRLIDQVGKAAANAGANGEPVSLCADVVRRSIEAKRPKTRYIVGRDGKIALFLRRILSDRRMDRIIGKGLDLEERVKKD